MENASKALLIAGGILLAIITLSLVVYMITAASSMADAQDSKTLAEQITAFNKEYEAYNKRVMYGTDVITAINKAINHNLTIENKTDDPYYINIIIETNQDFTTTGKKIDKRLKSDDEGYESNMNNDEIMTQSGKPIINISLSAGEYSLGNWTATGALTMNNGIIQFFENEKTDYTNKDNDYYYYIYSALTNFKRATFSCTEVHYNGVTGRIDSMTFEQR